MMLTTKLLFLALALAAVVANAQSPTPIVVQAVSALPAPATAPATSVADSHSTQDALKLLEQIKAANNEVLAKQKAALDRLDELQQAADQLKIFAKRG